MRKFFNFHTVHFRKYVKNQLLAYLEPNHWPFICSMAVVASFFRTNETKPYPLDLPVNMSLTTRQSLISPKGANADLSVSVSISGDRSPTKMWWCWDVSTFPCWLAPVELVAQLTLKIERKFLKFQHCDVTTIFVNKPSFLCPNTFFCSWLLRPPRLQHDV